MLYMARSDGSVDVWDLTDSSYRPAAQLKTTTAPPPFAEKFGGLTVESKRRR